MQKAFIQPQILNKWMLNTSVCHNHPSSPRASQESSFPTQGLFFPSPLWTPLVVTFSNRRPHLHREAFSDYLHDVNFMCQRDWVWDTQIFCSTLFWKCVCEGVLDESNCWIGRMNKADCPPQCGWVSSNQIKAWKRTSPSLSELTLVFCLWIQMWTESYTISSPPSGLDWNYLASIII